MLGLEPLQQWGESQEIQEGMEESEVDEWVCVKSIHCVLMSDVRCPCVLLAGVWRLFILVPMLISSGISEPHCLTLHTVCNSSNQNTIIAKSTSRVKRGRRRT